MFSIRLCHFYHTASLLLVDVAVVAAAGGDIPFLALPPGGYTLTAAP